jgi:hypothetical protein
MLGLGCQDIHEIFDNTTAALAGNLGATCGEEYPSAPGSAYVQVEDDVAARTECGGGSCVWQFDGTAAEPPSKAGTCSCRCAGPSGTGPFCDCGDGFVCEHLVDDLNVGARHIAGSYCVPAW